MVSSTPHARSKESVFETPVTNKLLFFERGASRRRRVIAVVFTGWFLLVLACLLWPIYPLFGSIEPFVLGLPLSMAWVVLWLVLSFAGLVTLYLVRYRGE